MDPLGGVDLCCGCFLPKMYVKMKELGHKGWEHAPGMPFRCANVNHRKEVT